MKKLSSYFKVRLNSALRNEEETGKNNSVTENVTENVTGNVGVKVGANVGVNIGWCPTRCLRQFNCSMPQRVQTEQPFASLTFAGVS
ncbi:MAG: hypothetical protein IKH22_10450 [Prevotella sp.]|nr:hypothetical protein [Prevotella sp.]